jgi:mannose-6-phosphate isomerase-like protein (cupin superfamily)
MVIKRNDDFTWQGVDLHPYKEEGGTHFKSITRQTLMRGQEDLNVEFRYFEMQPDGYSTLERHEHQHMVMILRGSGQVMVGGVITDIRERDVVHIPPMTWHQFRANNGDHLGFLCVVCNERDKPQRPLNAEEAEPICTCDEVRAFIRY